MRTPDTQAGSRRTLEALRPLVRLIALLRWRVALVLLMLIALGTLEGMGVVLLVPLLGSIGLEVQGGAVGRLAAVTSFVLGWLGLTPTLPLVLAVFLGVNLLLSLLRRTLTVLSASLEQEVVRAVAARLYGAIVRMDWLAFSRMRASDFIVALTVSADRAGAAASQMLAVAASLVVTTVYAGLALRLSVPIALATLTCGLVLVLSMRRRTAGSSRVGRRFHEATQELQAAVSDDLAGMKTIRSVAGETRSLSRLVALTERVSEARLAAARHYSNGTLLVDFGSMVLLSVLLLLAIERVQLEASGLLLLLFLFWRIVPRLSGLLQNFQYLASVLPSVQSVHDLEAACATNAEPVAAADTPLPFERTIRFESVSFRYSAERTAVLHDLDLEIRRGTTVALLGPSGSGKSTTADLLMGLLSPDHGQVLVDEVPLTRDRIGAWRQAVAYVAQETFLFHETIRANLLWAAPGATDDDMRSALRLAAADFVESFPQGLDTIVGDRGLRLSGGERQRIALARAVLRRPSVLVLDEATSALDAENESRTMEAIRGLHGSLTILIITHRPSAIADADVVHLLDGGRIVETTFA